MLVANAACTQHNTAIEPARGRVRECRHLAGGGRTIPCHVLSLQEVEPYVIALPLCLLPPLPAVGSGDFVEEEDTRGSSAKGYVCAGTGTHTHPYNLRRRQPWKQNYQRFCQDNLGVHIVFMK